MKKTASSKIWRDKVILLHIKGTQREGNTEVPKTQRPTEA